MATTTTSDSESEERYGIIETGDGDVVVYDREQTTAWVQSDYTVDLRA